MQKRQEQAKALKAILERLSQGASVDDVREAFLNTFESVDAAEIAAAEAELIKGGMPVEEILNLCTVHAAIVEGNVNVIEADPDMGHPLAVFYQENEGLEDFLNGQFKDAKEAF